MYTFYFHRCYSERDITQYDMKLGENAFITKAELRPCFQACQGRSFREWRHRIPYSCWHNR
jgi:hypothetical protein